MAGITIRGLSKSFGANAEVAAVNDIDLDIKDNSFVTLLGPSGCGKTTTLRLIAGYITPDKGTIEVDGRPISSPAAVVPPESRGMGMVFQNYAVWPHKTVFENVVFGLKLRRVPAAEAKKKVEETLGLVNLVPGRVGVLANGGGKIELGADLALDIATLDGLKSGDSVDVAIRPENISLGVSSGAGAARLARITNHVFLGNISEYYATLRSGQVLRVQTHPLQHFKVGDEVAIQVDATQCSVFRRDGGGA